MIPRRVIAHGKARNRTAIALDTVIVAKDKP